MMKQSKNKKGRLAKSTLSVVLAASMVMTSSSFVWASPVQEIPVAAEASTEEHVGDAVSKEWSDTLTAVTTGLEGDNITYLWTVSGSGETSTEATFRALTKDEIGKTITCVATDGGNGSTGESVTVDYSITPIKISDFTVGFNKTYTFNGVAQEPAQKDMEVSYNDKDGNPIILSNDEYTVEYGENIDAGAGSVTINFTSDYASASGYELEAPVEKSFDIEKADLSNYEITLDIANVTYTGEALEPLTGTLTITNKDDGSTLTLPADEYTAIYDNNTDASPYQDAEVTDIVAKAGAKNNFEGSISRIEDGYFRILQKESVLSIKAPVPNQTFTGSPIQPTVVVVDDAGRELVADDEYTLLYPSDITNMGQKTVRINSKNTNYTSTSTGTFSYTIVAGTVAGADFKNGISSYEFTGEAIEPEIELDGVTGVKDKDYEVTYSNNLNVTTPTSKAKATISFKGSLTGNNPIELTFDITPLAIDTDRVVIDAQKNQKFTFDGTAKKAVINSVSYQFKGRTVTLTEGKDYEIVQPSAVDVGSYSARIKGLGNYAADSLATVAFNIEKAPFNSTTVEAKANPLAYSGNRWDSEPTFKVSNKATGVKIDASEYTVYYLNDRGQEVLDFPTDMGDYKAVLVYDGSNYENNGKLTVDYSIGQVTLENAFVELSDEEFIYNPSLDGQLPVVVDVFAGKWLNKADANGKNGDCKVEMPERKDCKNVGTYTIKIIGLNTYAGQTKEVTFKIVPMEIDGLAISDVAAGTTHIGTVAAPYVSIKDRGYELVSGTDFEMNNDTANKVVTITGKGNYKTATPIKKNYTVSKSMALADPSIKAEVKGIYNYDRTQKRPKIDDIVLTEVYEGGSFVLRKGVDYSDTNIVYGTNVDAGKGTITLTGTGSYTGTRTIEFEIVGIDITADHKIDTVKLDKLNLTYDKADHMSVIKGAVSVVNSKTLAVLPDSNYKVKVIQDGKEVDKAINPGTYTVNVEGTGNYSGTLTYSATISGINLDKVANIPSKIDDQKYTGKEVTPEVTIAGKDSTVKLVKDTDYTVSYLNNTEVGTAYAVVKGVGIYGGTYLVPFAITGIDLSDATVAVSGTYTYTGEAIIPTVSVKVGDTVIDPANYDVVATDNTNAGTAKFTVVGKNNCTGTTKEATFEIGKADQKLAVSKTITDALKVRNTNANTYTLKVTGAGTALTYKSSNTKIASVSAAGKISFKHICGKATITVTAAADDNHNAATLKVAVAVKPATPKITVASKSKGFNVKATAVKDITGYQVGYSTDKNFAASKTTKKLVGTTKALDKNFSGLSSKKGYYVRVRAYKKVGSTVYWGNWTSAKKITTK